MNDRTAIQADAIQAISQMIDESVDLIIADPPYSSGARQTADIWRRNVMTRADHWETEWFGTDNLSTAGFMFFIRGVFLSLFQKAKEGAHLYCFIDWRNYPLLIQTLESAGWRPLNLIVWDKTSFALGSDYRFQHELIALASKGSPNPFNMKDVPNVIRVKRPRPGIHPTIKPIQLISTFVKMSSKEGDLVIDPFCGSGTTGEACAMLNRRFVGIDIDGKYVEMTKTRITSTEGQERLAIQPREEIQP